MIIKGLPAADMKRIYILGHSMGGHGTYIFIQLDPEYFACRLPPNPLFLPFWCTLIEFWCTLIDRIREIKAELTWLFDATSCNHPKWWYRDSPG